MSEGFVNQRREEIIDILTDALSKDIIDTDDYERRVEKAHAVENIADLNALISDLGSGARSRFARGSMRYPEPGTQELKSIFSSQRYEGEWLSRENVRVRVIMGMVACDLRQPVLGPVTKICVNAVMGAVKIIVPKGVGVQVNVNPVFAEVRRHSGDRKLGGKIKGLINSFLGMENSAGQLNPGSHPAASVELSGSAILARVTIIEKQGGLFD